MQTLTRKEEQIMQAVWQIGHPCLISEILKKDVTLKRNTVAPGIITLTKNEEKYCTKYWCFCNVLQNQTKLTRIHNGL